MLKENISAQIKNGMTIERCQEECHSAEYGYCGVEYGIECCKLTFPIHVDVKLILLGCSYTAPSDSEKEFPNGTMTGASGCDRPNATPCPGNPKECTCITFHIVIEANLHVQYAARDIE